MQVLRTPDERFAALPDFPYDAAVRDVRRRGRRRAAGALRRRGPGRRRGRAAAARRAVVVASSTATMIPVLVDGRACGRSRPTWSGSAAPTSRPSATDYTYARHVEWMRAALFDALDLRDITLVGQDWGGLIGLRLVAEHPDRFAARRRRQHVPADRRPARRRGVPPAGSGSRRRAPRLRRRRHRERRLHDRRSRPRSSPPTTRRSPTTPTRPARGSSPRWCRPARRPGRRGQPRPPGRCSRRWDKPFLTAFSDGDPITAGGDRAFQQRVPGAQGKPHTTIDGGGHFLQEDAGPELARVVVDLVAATPR